MYDLKPVGKYKLTVCTNLPCALRGGVDAGEYLKKKLGRDPALGSSVLITAVTDSGGFLIFLGLATAFLL
ncbi:MAG: NAD(P)H-dependent oxidoreductase subunit E, partial [Neisseria elongata]